MAIHLVENLSAKWEPGKYTDAYVENLMRIIQAKVKGRTPRLVERETPREAEVVDLMERLRASLERRRPERGATSLRQGYGGPPELQRRRKSPGEREREPSASAGGGAPAPQATWGPASTTRSKTPATRGRTAEPARPRKAAKGKRVA